MIISNISNSIQQNLINTLHRATPSFKESRSYSSLTNYSSVTVNTPEKNFHDYSYRDTVNQQAPEGNFFIDQWDKNGKKGLATNLAQDEFERYIHNLGTNHNITPIEPFFDPWSLNIFNMNNFKTRLKEYSEALKNGNLQFNVNRNFKRP